MCLHNDKTKSRQVGSTALWNNIPKTRLRQQHQGNPSVSFKPTRACYWLSSTNPCTPQPLMKAKYLCAKPTKLGTQATWFAWLGFKPQRAFSAHQSSFKVCCSTKTWQAHSGLARVAAGQSNVTQMPSACITGTLCHRTVSRSSLVAQSPICVHEIERAVLFLCLHNKGLSDVPAKNYNKGYLFKIKKGK